VKNLLIIGKQNIKRFHKAVTDELLRKQAISRVPSHVKKVKNEIKKYINNINQAFLQRLSLALMPSKKEKAIRKGFQEAIDMLQLIALKVDISSNVNEEWREAFKIYNTFLQKGLVPAIIPPPPPLPKKKKQKAQTPTDSQKGYARKIIGGYIQQAKKVLASLSRIKSDVKHEKSALKTKIEGLDALIKSLDNYIREVDQAQTVDRLNTILRNAFEEYNTLRASVPELPEMTRLQPVPPAPPLP